MKTLQLNLIINLLFLPSSFQAQTYGNEWIDYSQTYYHFNIFNNGIYQLDYATLDSAGVPLNTFQSENIQIFGKERELPIHIEDGGDNSIDPGDYILFYAERNDGWLDSTIYIDSSTIGNPAYSLYNDTLTYFFTWNSSTNNHRYTVETDINFSNYSSITNFITCKKEIYATQEYYDGTKDGDASISFYTAGEGWGSSKQNGAGGGHTTTLNFSTPFPYVGNGAPLAHFKGLSISASNAPNGGDNHFKKGFGKIYLMR